MDVAKSGMLIITICPNTRYDEGESLIYSRKGALATHLPLESGGKEE